MAFSRKDFIKKACFSGACLCGFTLLVEAGSSGLDIRDKKSDDLDKKLMQNWISTLLQSIDQDADDNTCRKVLKTCARSHYDHLQMDNILRPYEGNLEKFSSFLKKEWGWKIDFNKKEGLLIADENKGHCVCPMVNTKEGIKSSILCYCSEGFAELMFAKVVCHPVKATVVSSVLRGDASCKYKIEML